MGNRLDLVATRQPNADMEDVVKFLLCVDLGDESVDGFVSDFDEIRVRDNIDVVGLRGDPSRGEEGGDYFPRGIPGDSPEWLCWLTGTLNQLTEQRKGRTNPEAGDIYGDGITRCRWNCRHLRAGLDANGPQCIEQIESKRNSGSMPYLFTYYSSGVPLASGELTPEEVVVVPILFSFCGVMICGVCGVIIACSAPGKPNPRKRGGILCVTVGEILVISLGVYLYVCPSDCNF